MLKKLELNPIRFCVLRYVGESSCKDITVPRIIYLIRNFLKISWAIPVLLLGLATASYSGEYHAAKEETFAGTTDTLACSQCHTMHGSQGNQSLIYNGTDVNETYPKLLRHQTILKLCLFCHDGNNAGLSPPPPDVWGNLAPGQTNPSAGNLCAGYTASPPCPDRLINHSVGMDVSSTEPPGFVGTWSNVTNKYTTTFNCEYCHDQHGNTNYRNLRTNPGSASGVVVSYSMGPAGDGTKHVNNLIAPGRGVAKYETSNVVYRQAPANTTSGIQGFCKGCHTKFHFRGGEDMTEMGGSTTGDTSAVGDEWLRHPTMDVSLSEGGSNLHVDYVNWQTSLSWRPRIINPAGTPGNKDDEPFCFTCHRVHGSTRHSNLIFGAPDSVGGSGSNNDPATAMMRDTCQQCHNQ